VSATVRSPLRFKIRHAERLARHWLHFRTRVHPGHVRFPGVVDLHFDPRDQRAQWLRKHRGITQSSVTGTWIAADRLLAPDLALDIGANYGEVSLVVRYGGSRRLMLFEPNPVVLSQLRRSVATHADSTNIVVVPLAVGDAPGRASLIVDEGYSGTSTLRQTASGSAEPVEVEVTTIDDALAPEDLSSRRLLFKIDVEGFEGHVLAGMQSTLSRCEAFVGIIEFDRAYLEEVAPGNAERTAELLLGLGTCRYLDDDHGIWPFERFADLPAHSDVVVSSDAALLERLRIPGWVRSR
jgi:FkbM family methyltransferase